MDNNKSDNALKWTPDIGQKEYYSLINKVIDERKHPLLVLFYPPSLGMEETQIEQLYGMLRDSDLHQNNQLEHLDVLLHTMGGDPVTAYRIAQTIRDFAKRVTFLVPQYAYSAGTLLCLSANEILLGDHAVLSPMDIKIIYGRDVTDDNENALFPDESPNSEVETVAIDYFIKVAKEARVEIETAFRQRGWKTSKTDVDSALLTEMTKQLGVLSIAKYYREKNTAQEYAEELLHYMFDNNTTYNNTRKILRQLILEAPSHDFPMDFHICEDIGLKVVEMSEYLSDATRSITKGLEKLAYEQVICVPSHGVRVPLYQYFSSTKPKDDLQSISITSAEAKEEAYGSGNGHEQERVTSNQF